MLLRLVSALLAVALGFVFLSVRTHALCSGEEALIWLEGEEKEGGEVEIAVCLESSRGVCGVLLDIIYDSDEFLLLSVGVECFLELSYVDLGGRVRVLLDGVENCDAEGTLLRLYFIRRMGGGGAAEFLIRGAEAYSIFGEGIIRENVLVGRGFVIGGSDVQLEGVELVSLSVGLSEEGEVELGMTLAASKDAFAVGVRLFLIDLGSNGERSDVLISSVGAVKGSEMRCSFSVTGACCVVITPIVYVGRHAFEGEKRVTIINFHDGDVIADLT